MERFYKKLRPSVLTTTIRPPEVIPQVVAVVETNVSDIEVDPGLRKHFNEIAPSEKDRIRRTYLLRGPFQPLNHEFPFTKFGKKNRRFRVWFRDYASWLEYSISKDAAFCLCCYLFKDECGSRGNNESFVNEGYRNWKKPERFGTHVGNHNSIHNQCQKACDDLMNRKQHIDIAIVNQSDQLKINYRIQLCAAIDCIKFLLVQGLAFRGHDESETSRNRGNFLELLSFLSNHNDRIKDVFKNAPENNKLTAPLIQKDITNACAVLTTKAIISELGDEVFSVLVDEARDVSNKEQMVVVLRFVDKKGCVLERFIGIVHVTDTTAISLKAAIESLLATYGLSLTRIRGQGYDGASNMQGEFNGLKSLILEQNKSAHFVHCFTHQLQLTLVAVTKNHKKLGSFFNYIAILTNVVGGSCKRRVILRENRLKKVVDQLNSGELTTGRGLNQELSLKRATDTRWGSHYGVIVNLIGMYPSVIDLLEFVENAGTLSDQRAEANDLLDVIQYFKFAFLLHMMKTILGITNELSQALQRKDQDIINAMDLVKTSKIRFQNLRENGLEPLLEETYEFCNKNSITIPSMEDIFVPRGRSRRGAEQITNKIHYRTSLFYTVIDAQIVELNVRFNKANTELLLCMSCLNPSTNFAAFDRSRLIRFDEFYPTDFSPADLLLLENQLQNYIIDVKYHIDFLEVNGISKLAQKMVETRKDIVYPLVFYLVKLALTLSVATARVERAFSAMKIVKQSLRNRMGDCWMNDCLLTYIEKGIFENVSNEEIIKQFQEMKTRRISL